MRGEGGGDVSEHPSFGTFYLHHNNSLYETSHLSAEERMR